MSRHVMVDLETMGTSSRAAIVAIGAVEFFPRASLSVVSLGRSFYENVDLQSSIGAGLDVDAATIYWWLFQQPEARARLTNPEPIHIHEALSRLSRFLGFDEENHADVFVWGKGPAFDNAILWSAYRLAGLRRPVSHRADRDVRTILHLASEAGLDVDAAVPREGVRHDALADAAHQARQVVAAWRYLGIEQFARGLEPLVVSASTTSRPGPHQARCLSCSGPLSWFSRLLCPACIGARTRLG